MNRSITQLQGLVGGEPFGGFLHPNVGETENMHLNDDVKSLD